METATSKHESARRRPEEEDHHEADDEEADEHDEKDSEDDCSSTATPEKKKSKLVYTGRGVTLNMLMNEHLIEPGELCMSIEYLGQKFTGDLLSDGRIFCHELGMTYNSPSAWAIACKKVVNPAKKSGCGWASVRYKGKKLDAIKTSWFRKQRSAHLAELSTPNDSGTENGNDSGSEFDVKRIKVEPVDQMTEGPLNLSVATADNKVALKRESVRHTELGRRSSDNDPTLLVECASFASLGKIQPFTVSVSSSTLLLMDFHSHLTSSEITGYVGGKWDPNTQHLSIMQAFPCRCRLGDRESAGPLEDEIRQNMHRLGITVVGWYHSHPHSQANPSLRDMDSQMEYQLKLKGDGHIYQPCLGIILSPYNTHEVRKESTIRAFYVLPPPENRPHDYGIPMDMSYDMVQDLYITQDLLTEMKLLIELYRGAPDMLKFKDSWRHTDTYLDKLKISLARHFPRDQTDGKFLEYLHNLLDSS